MFAQRPPILHHGCEVAKATGEVFQGLICQERASEVRTPEEFPPMSQVVRSEKGQLNVTTRAIGSAIIWEVAAVGIELGDDFTYMPRFTKVRGLGVAEECSESGLYEPVLNIIIFACCYLGRITANSEKRPTGEKAGRRVVKTVFVHVDLELTDTAQPAQYDWGIVNDNGIGALLAKVDTLLDDRGCKGEVAVDSE